MQFFLISLLILSFASHGALAAKVPSTTSSVQNPCKGKYPPAYCSRKQKQ
jgi:hypothetical protein